MQLKGFTRRRLGLTATTCVSLATGLGASATAHAAPTTGLAEVTIAKQSKVGRALDAADVKASAIEPATGRRALSFPITDLEVGPPLSTSIAGAIKLDAGRRVVKLKNLRIAPAGDATRIHGSIAGKTIALFEAEGVLAQTGTVDAPKLSLDSGRLMLANRAARTISRKLRIERLPDADAGSLRVSVDLAPSNPPSEDPLSEDPPTEDPQGEAYPYATQCPVGTSAVTNDPQDAAAPAAAPTLDLPQGVASSSVVEWGFLASFRNYVVNVPTAGTIQPIDGATGSGANLAVPGAFVSYSGADGEYEAGNEINRSDDRLVASAAGTTLFCKAGHGFNVVLKNPTVTLDGGQSRLTMDVGANYGGTWHPFQRVDVATLDLSGVDPVPSSGGNVVTWADIPATLTADGAKALALDTYPAGTALDAVTVRTTLERPFIAACTPPLDDTNVPAVGFTLETLPALGTTVAATGGTLNWGFRRATRNSVARGANPATVPASTPPPNDPGFSVYGGATESHPGNMGGAAGPPPTGGDGKFFGFPINSATYEAGTADPGDDRLIAKSDATVVMCNDHSVFGSYGVVLSRPALVIDDTNSRITANAYSVKAQNWAGGRVELVDLDTTAIDATYGSGTVTWTDIPVTGGLKTDALTFASLTPAGTTSGWDPVTVSINVP